MRGISRKRKALSNISNSSSVSLLPVGASFAASGNGNNAAAVSLLFDRNRGGENDENTLLSLLLATNSGEDVSTRIRSNPKLSHAKETLFSHEILSTLQPHVYWKIHIDGSLPISFIDYIEMVDEVTLIHYLQTCLRCSKEALAERTHFSDMLLFIFQLAYCSEANFDGSTSEGISIRAQSSAARVMKGLLFDASSSILTIEDIFFIDKIRNVVSATSDRKALTTWEVETFCDLLIRQLRCDCSNYDLKINTNLSRELGLFPLSVVQTAFDREMRKSFSSVSSSGNSNSNSFFSIGCVSNIADFSLQPFASYYIRQLLLHDIRVSGKGAASAEMLSTQHLLDVINACCRDAAFLNSSDFLLRSLRLLWHIAQLLDSIASSSLSSRTESIMETSGCKAFHKCFMCFLENQINVENVNASVSSTAMASLCSLLTDIVNSLPLPPLRLICKCLNSYKHINENAFNGLISVVRQRAALIEKESSSIMTKSRNDNDNNPITIAVTADKVRSWYETLSKVKQLPASVSQLCQSRPDGGSVFMQQLNALMHRDPTLPCAALVRAMAANHPPLCSAAEASVFGNPPSGVMRAAMEDLKIDLRCLNSTRAAMSHLRSANDLLLDSEVSSALPGPLPVENLCISMREAISLTIDSRSKRYVGTLFSLCVFRIAAKIAETAQQELSAKGNANEYHSFLCSWLLWCRDIMTLMMSSDLLRLSLLSLIVALLQGVDIDLHSSLQEEGSLATSAVSIEGVGLLLASLVREENNKCGEEMVADILISLAGYLKATSDANQEIAVCTYTTKLLLLLCATAFWIDKAAAMNSRSFEYLFTPAGRDDFENLMESKYSYTFISNATLSACLTIKRSRAVSAQSQLCSIVTSVLSVASRRRTRNSNSNSSSALISIVDVLSKKPFRNGLFVEKVLSRGCSYTERESRVALCIDNCLYCNNFCENNEGEEDVMMLDVKDADTGHLQHIFLLLLQILQDLLGAGNTFAAVSGEEIDTCLAVATVVISKALHVSIPTVLTGESAVIELIQFLKRKSAEHKDLVAPLCLLLVDKISSRIYSDESDRTSGIERLRSHIIISENMWLAMLPEPLGRCL